MLTNPFSGKELFALYQNRMVGWDEHTANIQWEEDIGKTKKAAWNNLAKVINERMRSEPFYIKGEQSPEGCHE